MSAPRPITQSERLARVETLIDEKVVPLLEAINKKVDDDVADLARLKNRGAGILVGVSMAFTALGALLRPTLESIIGIFR